MDTGLTTRVSTCQDAVTHRVIQELFTRSTRFTISDIDRVCADLSLPRLGNKADLVYGYRFRFDLPDAIERSAPDGWNWVIELVGKGEYEFVLRRVKWITPSPDQPLIKLPDMTPQILKPLMLNDEQAMLTRLRHNRLIDTFLGASLWGAQSHLRTTVGSLNGSQIELDDLYFGLMSNGVQLAVPVQAKGGTDRLAAVQTRQDVFFCRETFPNHVCRPVSVYCNDTHITLFEFAMHEDEVTVLNERHYQLVDADVITAADLRFYHSLPLTASYQPYKRPPTITETLFGEDY